MTATALCLLALAAAPADDVHTDYYEAYRTAQDEGRMLLIDFESGFDFERLDPRRLQNYVLCRLPVDYEIETEGGLTRLLDSPAFKHLDGGPGVAIVDLRHPRLLGRVVSLLPQRHLTAAKVAHMLALPTGTLTQRTLVWAFRIHRERPLSVYADPDHRLMAHCQRHCLVQCRANNQHHCMQHPGSSEIVAESWPWNHNIVDAAIDIVWSWRQSPGHWRAASRRWARYGYDMKHNGQKWYATGVFE